MPDIKFATVDVAAMRLGTTTITKVMLGTGLVWPTVSTTFPVAVSATNETGLSLGAANAITSPASVAAGDLLVAFCTNDASDTAVTPSTGWTQIATLGIATAIHSLTAVGRVADGSGNDALALTGAAQDYCAVLIRITGHGVTNVATDIKVATASATSTNPNPPSLDAGSVKKWLWLAAAGADTTASYGITFPVNYTSITGASSTIQSATGSTGSALARICQRSLETQTEDPGVFTAATSRPWIAMTLAIPPAP